MTSLRRRAVLGVFLACALPWGCTDVGTEAADGGAADGGACWPASSDTLDPTSNTGCRPMPSLPVCQVPSGATVLADGATVADDGAAAPPECTDACGVAEYALSCVAASPDTALHCTVVAVPTPSNESFFCCPCATGTP